MTLNLTKIVATIGPSSESLEFLQTAKKVGLTVLRLNFSHGSVAEQLARIKHAHKINQQSPFAPYGVMLDTKGPELRIGQFLTKEQLITRGSMVKIYTTAKRYQDYACQENEITLSHNVAKSIQVGTLILVDDGKLQLQVKNIDSNFTSFTAEAQNEHTLIANKRVNIPNVDFGLPFLSEKDHADLALGCKAEVDFFALSFVSGPEDIAQVRTILKKHHKPHIKLNNRLLISIIAGGIFNAGDNS